MESSELFLHVKSVLHNQVRFPTPLPLCAAWDKGLMNIYKENAAIRILHRHLEELYLLKHIVYERYNLAKRGSDQQRRRGRDCGLYIRS